MSKKYLLGLLGHPVSQSLSPVIHRAALQCAGLDGSYELFDVKSNDLKELIDDLKKQNYSGLNVTIPHKLKVMDYVDVLSKEAIAVGAVNTLKIDNKKNSINGYNTDVVGFKNALCIVKKEVSPVLVYGYGGSSRAILVALAELGYDNICVTGRDQEKVIDYVSKLGPLIANFSTKCKIRQLDRQVQLGDFGLLVNCSPIGLNELDLPNGFISCIEGMANSSSPVSKKLVFDLVYSKDKAKETKVVSLAKEYGMQACDGYEMLIRQAMGSFELWTGKEIARSSLDERLKF